MRLFRDRTEAGARLAARLEHLRGTDVIVVRKLGVPHGMEIVPGATHLFEEPGALEAVAELASGWFTRHPAPAARPTAVT